jgi:hypothetical protein
MDTSAGVKAVPPISPKQSHVLSSIQLVAGKRIHTIYFVILPNLTHE